MPSYFVLDTAHAGYAAKISACQTAHAANAPGTVLSVFLNTNGTRTLVKVAGVAKDWLSGAGVLDKADQDDHYRMLEMCYGEIGGWVEQTAVDGGAASATHSDTLDGGLV